MNSQGIALAADSAVTSGQGMGQKIFTSASKIFMLSKFHPIGVMIYGDANLMRVPWETVIKLYRIRLGRRTFKAVSEYASDFLLFLCEDEKIYSEEIQDRYVEGYIFSYYRLIQQEITSRADRELDNESEIEEADLREIASMVVQTHYQKWREADSSLSVPETFRRDFRTKYRSLIRQAKKEIFEQLPITSQSSRRLTEIAINLFLKFPDGIWGPSLSGIVFAGFGTGDVFPVLEAYSVEGRIGDYLKHKRDEGACSEISFSNRASIVPFAQSEMVLTFLTGIDPDYQEFLDEYMRELCSDYPQVLVDSIDGLNNGDRETIKKRLRDVGQRKFERYTQELTKYRRENYIDLEMSVVWALPKDELAEMAESLISLTSFKRRVSATAETVSGPIDVAVISKGDGFIWIKRKHYFQRDLNHHFLANYFREDQPNERENEEEAGPDDDSLDERAKEALPP